MDEKMAIHISTINAQLAIVEDHKEDAWSAICLAGESLYLAKNSFDGNTKDFGEFLATNCPDLDVKQVSYMIKLAGHNDDSYEPDRICEKLQEVKCRSIKPRSMWDAFVKAVKPVEPVESIEEPSDVEETKVEPNPAESYLARFQTICDELEKVAVDLSESDLLEIKRQAINVKNFTNTLV